MAATWAWNSIASVLEVSAVRTTLKRGSTVIDMRHQLDEAQHPQTAGAWRTQTRAALVERIQIPGQEFQPIPDGIMSMTGEPRGSARPFDQHCRKIVCSISCKSLDSSHSIRDRISFFGPRKLRSNTSQGRWNRKEGYVRMALLGDLLHGNGPAKFPVVNSFIPMNCLRIEMACSRI